MLSLGMKQPASPCVQFLASRSARMAPLLTFPCEILCHQGCYVDVAHGRLSQKTNTGGSESSRTSCLQHRPTTDNFVGRSAAHTGTDTKELHYYILP